MMCFRRAVCAAVGLALAPLAAGPASAQAGDALCPRAVPRLAAFDEAGKSGDPAKIAAAARSVAEAYLVCWNDAKVNTYIEPTANYDETRLAQYLVVAGRASAAGSKTAEAASAFRDARKYAEEVADWTPASQTVHQSSGLSGNSSARNSDRQPSRYRDAAVAVRDAAIEGLAKLNAPASPSVSPSPAPSAKP